MIATLGSMPTSTAPQRPDVPSDLPARAARTSATAIAGASAVAAGVLAAVLGLPLVGLAIGLVGAALGLRSSTALRGDRALRGGTAAAFAFFGGIALAAVPVLAFLQPGFLALFPFSGG